jgi:hypothetical protein
MLYFFICLTDNIKGRGLTLSVDTYCINGAFILAKQIFSVINFAEWASRSRFDTSHYTFPLFNRQLVLVKVGAFIGNEVGAIMYHGSESDKIVHVLSGVMEYFVTDGSNDCHGMTFFLFVVLPLEQL